MYIRNRYTIKFSVDIMVCQCIPYIYIHSIPMTIYKVNLCIPIYIYIYIYHNKTYLMCIYIYICVYTYEILCIHLIVT